MSRVLIVDDDRDVAMALAHSLSVRGHTVKWAWNGKEGIKTFQERGPFDAVLSDMNMPIMSGPEMISEIYKLAPDTHFVTMTGDRNIPALPNVKMIYKGSFRYEDIANALLLDSPEENPFAVLFAGVFAAVTGATVEEAITAQEEGPAAEQQLLRDISSNAKRSMR